MATNKNQKPHAIMISFHLQGHIIPFVNLALKLASKGFSITFAHLDYIHNQISKSHYNTIEIDIFAQARQSGLDIHYTTFNDGFPVDFDRAANFDQHLESFLYRFPDKVDELVGKIIRSDSSSASKYFLIADTFSVWPAKIAKKYGLVNVSFWTEPALVFSLYYHLDTLRENGHVPVIGRQENVDYVPGVKSINTKDFMSFLQDSELQLLHKIIFGAFEAVKSADFILCNTVEELEAETIVALQQKQPFFAIGPLFPSDFSKNFVPKSLLPEVNPIEWLNSKPPESVLYVSFGSLAKTEKSVILEIACGLLMSGVNFIWALRPGNADSENAILPEGFEDSVKDRGLVLPWCAQNEVLLSAATGGFLTHCGWNSILESIWYKVPLICYPLFTDQITNRKLVVDDWGVGINLCDGECIKREEVAEKIGKLMSGEMRDEMTKGIMEVRKTMQNASSEDGSSERNFDCFVEAVSHEVLRRCKKM